MKKMSKMTIAAMLLGFASIASAGCFTFDWYFGSLTVCCGESGCEIQQL